MGAPRFSQLTNGTARSSEACTIGFHPLFLFIPAIKACPGRKASGQALVTVCAYGTMAFSLQ